MLLKAAINGARSPREHARLPTTPHQQAEAALASFEAGAGAVHAHVRDATGAESLAAGDVAAVTSAIRARCGDRPFGFSTGAWILPHPARRLAAISAWTLAPDFASVNLAEEGALEVADALLAGGGSRSRPAWPPRPMCASSSPAASPRAVCASSSSRPSKPSTPRCAPSRRWRSTS